MSRALPAHANLEHLKKQAKDLLQESQQPNPRSKLADAQHAIAREYGFASWPKLKAHVELLARPADPAVALAAAPPQRGSGGGGGGVAANVVDDAPFDCGFGRYTPKARQTLYFSRDEAARVGSVAIEPEHVLLGLIRAGQGLASRIFERAHLSLEHARAEVAAHTVVRAELPTSVEIPFGAGTMQILRCAIEEAETAAEADSLRPHNIGLAHLLLGILRDERSLATALLNKKGMRLQAVRDDIVHLLNEEAM